MAPTPRPTLLLGQTVNGTTAMTLPFSGEDPAAHGDLRWEADAPTARGERIGG